MSLTPTQIQRTKMAQNHDESSESEDINIVELSDDEKTDKIINCFFINSSSPYHIMNDFTNNIIRMHETNLFSNHISIIHFNARNLFNKMTSLNIIMEQFNYFFNIIVISKTWLKDHVTNLINLYNYNF